MSTRRSRGVGVAASAYTCVCTARCAGAAASGERRAACGVRGSGVAGVRARPLRSLDCRASVPLGRRAHVRYRRLPSALPHCKIVYKNLTDYCKNTDILQYVSSHVSLLDKPLSNDAFILLSSFCGNNKVRPECNHNVASGRRGCPT